MIGLYVSVVLVAVVVVVVGVFPAVGAGVF